MSLVLRCLLITALVSTLTNAESLIELGLQGAMNSLKSVPPQTTKIAEATATKLLQTYLRPTQGGFYLRYKGSTGKWVEVKDLRFQRISLGTITNADRANGVSDRLVISLTAEMHRTQTSSQAWSEWQYGMPGFLPRAIRVERKNGQWSASSIILSLLEPCNDQPISIPSRIVAMPIAKASPPVTHPSSPSPAPAGSSAASSSTTTPTNGPTASSAMLSWMNSSPPTSSPCSASLGRDTTIPNLSASP